MNINISWYRIYIQGFCIKNIIKYRLLVHDELAEYQGIYEFMYSPSYVAVGCKKWEYSVTEKKNGFKETFEYARELLKV